MATSSSQVPTIPPPYSPTTTSPTYTTLPSEGERRVQYSPHSMRAFTVPSGVFSTRGKNIQVSIFEQEDGSSAPVFDRGSFMTGTISLAKWDDVKSVSIKLIGRMNISVVRPVSNGKGINLVDQKITLWDGNRSEAPGTLTFSIPFPKTFEYQGSTHILPPSHQIMYAETYALHSKCKYSLVVKVVRKKNGFFLGVLSRSLRIPVIYYPKNRAPLPIMYEPHLFATIKTSPEEWSQHLITVKPKVSTGTPIYCILFIPSVRVFGLSDKIPFHVQFNGPAAALRDIIPEAIQVQLIRQLQLRFDGTPGVVREKRVIGEAKLVRNLPPGWTPSADSSSISPSMDFEGELQCDQEETIVPSFTAADIAMVQDFFVLTVRQPSKYTYIQWAFQPVRVAVSILLTTDPWGDSYASVDNIGLI